MINLNRTRLCRREPAVPLTPAVGMTGVRPGRGGRADVALYYAKTNDLPKVPKRRMLAQRERHERQNAISGTHGPNTRLDQEFCL
jgi:hypothetical protein